MSDYEDVDDDNWIRPVMKGWKLACCDCHLVHIFDFRIVKGRVEVRIKRDNRATGAKRRKHKKEILIVD